MAHGWELLIFPEVPEAYFWGLWSAVQSGESGAFADPPVLDIQFSQAHSSSGLTLHFYAPTGDWASKLKIQWYGADGGLLASALFTPDAVDFYCAKKVDRYRRIRLTFLETNHPGRYLKLAGLDYGVYLHFAGDEIVKAHVLEECDPLSAEISINTLGLTLYNKEGRFSILNPEGYFDVLQHKQKLTVWEDVRPEARSTSSTSYCMGTFYLSDWETAATRWRTLPPWTPWACWTAHLTTAAFTTPLPGRWQRTSWKDTATPWTRNWPLSGCRDTWPRAHGGRLCSSWPLPWARWWIAAAAT